jgi:hypothetical protein
MGGCVYYNNDGKMYQTNDGEYWFVVHGDWDKIRTIARDNPAVRFEAIPKYHVPGQDDVGDNGNFFNQRFVRAAYKIMERGSTADVPKQYQAQSL